MPGTLTLTVHCGDGSLSGTAIGTDWTTVHTIRGSFAEIAFFVTVAFNGAGSNSTLLRVATSDDGTNFDPIQSDRQDGNVPGISVEHTYAAATGTSQRTQIQVAKAKHATHVRLQAKNSGAVAGDTVSSAARGGMN